MVNFLIGAGGWTYFNVPGLKSLEAYSRAFNFVEVNSTFYKIPSLSLVRSWRRRVPSDFVFSVRCHKDVTHKYRLEPVEKALETFTTMKDICRLLNANFLVLETPPTLSFSDEKVKSARDFLESVDLKDVKLVWEVRRKRGDPVPVSLVNLMRDYDVTHCVDLSREDPALETDLLEIDQKINLREPRTAVVSFHNVKMYKDAARYKVYRLTGKFPPVTRAEGQLSLKEVLMEDAKFPATKQQLINDQGWKVIDLTKERRVHAYTLLERLPDKTFRDIDEVLNNLT